MRRRHPKRTEAEPTIQELLQSVSVAKTRARKPKGTRRRVIAELTYERQVAAAAMIRQVEIDPAHVTARRDAMLAEDVLYVARLAAVELVEKSDSDGWLSPLRPFQMPGDPDEPIDERPVAPAEAQAVLKKLTALIQPT